MTISYGTKIAMPLKKIKKKIGLGSFNTTSKPWMVQSYKSMSQCEY